MADLEKPTAGKPLYLKADTFGTLIDMAQEYRRRGIVPKPGGAADVPPSSTVLRLLNNSGATGTALERGEILRISGSAISPTDDVDAALSPIILTGDDFLSPDPTDANNAVAVTLEPIAHGEIGRVAVDGVAWVQASVATTGTYACVGSTGTAAGPGVALTDGPLKIIWKESGTGTKYALCKFERAASVSGSGGQLVYASIVDSNTISNTTTETDFDTNVTLAANFLTAGMVLRISLGGQCRVAHHASPDEHLTLYAYIQNVLLTSALFIAQGTASGSEEFQFYMEVFCTVRSVVSGVANIQVNLASCRNALIVASSLSVGNPVTMVVNYPGYLSINVNANNPAEIKAAGQYLYASATNAAKLTQFVVESLTP